jgi:eukaryotic-like serine/threonine-protein kinase
VGAGGFWLLSRDSDGTWFREVAIPKIESDIAVGNWAAAFASTAQAQARLGDINELQEIWPRLSWTTTIDSEPRGAKVFLRPYASEESDWKEFGRTPLENIRIPFGLLRLKLELDGYLPLYRTLGGGLASKQLPPRGNSVDGLNVGTEVYRLDTSETLPKGKVRVPGWTERIGGETVTFGDYFLDRTEVTNAQFKAFVAAGGYERPELWDPIVRDGEVLPWKEAMQLFTDRTGRRGPSTWEAGDFKLGEEDFPVAGVSWYEAAAFARYRGEQLPTAFHWRRARAQGAVPWVMAASNLGSEGPRAVTASTAMSFVGAYDLAGNEREWTASAARGGRIIAGGSWDDEPYVASQSVTAVAPPLDRSPANGFRLAIIRDSADVREHSFTPLVINPVPKGKQPVSDEAFNAYASFFDYEHKPLNVSIDREEHTRLWTRQRITFDSPYDSSREVLYLYLPASGSPPYQTVLYWPSGGAYLLDSIDADSMDIDFIVQSGRAVAWPIYAGTYERRNDRGPPFAPRSPIAYRDNVTEGVIDLRRSLDYLEERADIDTSAFAYFGLSQGGVNAPIVLSHESRLRVAVSYVGFIPNPPPPGELEPAADPLHALPRVRVPLLLLSGEFDSTAPLESARLYFALLGTPESDKKHVVAPGGHFVPRDLLVRETLDWLDRYLGTPRGQR